MPSSPRRLPVRHAVWASHAEFWSVFATLDADESLLGLLNPFLPQLVPLLLKVFSSSLSHSQNMRYSEDELERLNVESAQVDANGVRPFISHGDKDDRSARRQGLKRSKDQGNDEEGEWTLRRASAWSLDCCANTYSAEVFDIIMPLISVAPRARSHP